MQTPTPVWTSLEIVKLTISALTPLLVLVIGLWINRKLKRLDYLQWTNQKLTEKRIAVFDDLAPRLNDLYCYFTFRGCWKDLSPNQVVANKREMDKIAHVNAPLFSKEFFTRYNDFIAECYQPYAGWGHDAKLRTPWGRRMEAAGSSWKEEWETCFAESSECSNPREVEERYTLLMSCLSNELGVGLRSDHVPSGFIPANIR